MASRVTLDRVLRLLVVFTALALAVNNSIILGLTSRDRLRRFEFAGISPLELSILDVGICVAIADLALAIAVFGTGLIQSRGRYVLGFVGSTVAAALSATARLEKLSSTAGPLFQQLLHNQHETVASVAAWNAFAWGTVACASFVMSRRNIPSDDGQTWRGLDGVRSTVLLIALVAFIAYISVIFSSLPNFNLLVLWLAAVLAVYRLKLKHYVWTKHLERGAPFAAFACISIFSADILFRALTSFDVPRAEAPLDHFALLAVVVVLTTVWMFEKHAALPFLGLLLYFYGGSSAANLVSGGALLGRVSPDVWGPVHFEVGLCLVALQTLLIAAYRLQISWFIAHAALMSALLIANVQDWWLAALTVLSVVASLILINLVVQFFIENGRDLASTWRNAPAWTRFEILWRSVWLWLPAIGLVLLGAHIQATLQAEMQSSLYNKEIVLDRPAVDGITPRRALKPDSLYTLNQREQMAHSQWDARLDAASREGEKAIEAIPREVRAFIDEMRPPRIADKACAGVSIKVKKIKISLRGLCRMILGVVDEGVQGAFNRAAARINAAVERIITQADQEDDVRIAELREIGHSEIGTASDEIRATLNAFFAFLTALQLASALSLVASVLHGLNMVAGRVAFDANRKAGTAPPSTFQLAPGNAEPLQSTLLGDTLHFSSPDLAGSTHGWYGYILSKRSGHGTHLRLRCPQTFAGVLNRLFTFRYWLTWVDTTPANLVNISSAIQPIAQIAHHSLVAIKIPANQQVVFRMRDLFAFTSNAQLASVYTTHVGAGLLGLSRFYTVASADTPATIVLRAYGESVQSLTNGNQTSPDSFLSWDRRTKFSVAQELSLAGVWMVPPHMKVQSDNAVVADKRPEGLLTPVFNVWRLLRHLFLPI